MKPSLVVRRRPHLAPPTQRRVAVTTLFACLLLLASPSAHGQNGPAPTGVTDVGDATATPIPGAGHDYIKFLSETVNPAPAKPELHHLEAIAL